MPDYTPFLRPLDVFRPLPDDELARIAARLRERRYRAGEVVFRQGDPADAMFFVFDGRVKIVSLDPQGQERVLAFTDEGGFFGEMALLTGGPRSTDVVAALDTTRLELRRADFEERVASHPLVLRQLLCMLAERQSVVNARLLQRPGADEDAVGSEGARGKVITVFSSRGGSGKTTVAVNLAVALAQQHPEQVVLLDLALTFGHTALVLDLQPRTSLASIGLDAISRLDRDTLNRYLDVHSSRLRLLPGSIRPEDGEGVQEHVQHVVAVLKRYFTCIVIDTSSNFADTTLAALEVSDKIVLVVTPELTSIRDFMECQRIFNDLVHIPMDRVYCLLNQPYGFQALSRGEFETGVHRSVDGELPFGGDLPVQAAMRGQPLLVSQPSAPIARAIDDLARVLVGAPVRAPGARDGAAARRPGGPPEFLRRR